MLSLFDSKNRDIQSIVETLTDSTRGITNESCTSDREIQNTKDFIQETMYNHYMDALGITDENSAMASILKEDAEQVSQMFINNLVENSKGTPLASINEASAIPALATLTASIAINMRVPYEATLHRMYDTRTLDKATVEIEDVIPTIIAPGKEAVDLIDAFQPGFDGGKDDALFVDQTEIVLTDLLETGIVPGKDCKNTNLTEGLDPLYRINRDMRIDHIELAASTTLQDVTLKLQKGSTPYFDSKTHVMNVTYEAVDSTGAVVAEEKIAALRHVPGAGKILVIHHIGLFIALAVDIQLPVVQRHLIPRQADDPLDEDFAQLVALKHQDIPPLHGLFRRVHVGGEQDGMFLDGGQHGAGGHPGEEKRKFEQQQHHQDLDAEGDDPLL